jgi:beta-aspartyl-dipeptidase (metallo-type)
VRDAVRQDGVPLATALRVITANPAHILKLGGKGRLAPGADADLVLLDEASLEIDGVMAGGRWLMKGRDVLARGRFE